MIGAFARILLVALAWTALRALWRSARRRGGARDGGEARALGRLVPDPNCGVLVPLADAPSLVVRGTRHHFCSESCRAEFRANSGL